MSPQPSTHQLPAGSRRAEQVSASPSAIARRKAAATVLLQASSATSLAVTSRRVQDRAIGSTLPQSFRAGARRSEEHTSELRSLMRISYAVFCLKKKNKSHLSHNHSPKHDPHTLKI